MSEELDLMSKVMLVNSAHEIFGKKAARNLWRTYGLPDCSEFIPKEEAYSPEPMTVDRMKELILARIEKGEGRATHRELFKMFGGKYSYLEIKDVCVLLQCEMKITCKNIFDKNQNLTSTVYMMMDKKPTA
jgi:hypothetical protein